MSSSQKYNLTLEQCEMWRNKPTINPATNRKIKLDGETYKVILNECAQVYQNNISRPEKRLSKVQNSTQNIENPSPNRQSDVHWVIPDKKNMK